MSSVTALFRKSRERKHPVLEKFEVESDARFFRALGISALLGAGLLSFLFSHQSVISRVLNSGTFAPRFVPKDDGPIVFRLPPQAKKAPAKVAKRSAPDAKPKAAHGNPHADPTQWVVRELTSRSPSRDLSAYTLIPRALSRDLDKLTERVSVVTHRGDTRIGERRGRMEVEGPGSPDGEATGSIPLDNLWQPGPSTKLLTPARGGDLIPGPGETGLDVSLRSGQRSSESILSVIRQHVRGLRHTYNQHLLRSPGLKGKVTLRFTIAPSGAILELSVVSSTTGAVEFDQAIRNDVLGWRFEPVRGSANDGVTVPFNFSE